MFLLVLVWRDPVEALVPNATCPRNLIKHNTLVNTSFLYKDLSLCRKRRISMASSAGCFLVIEHIVYHLHVNV